MMDSPQKRILLAEDEEHLARLIVFKLKKEGFDVTWVPNGMAAWERLQRQDTQTDLVILDVMMPVMGGLEVLKNLKSDVRLKTLPVLILTAKGFHSDVMNASNLGAEQFMRKPFEPSVLVATIQKMLGIV